jgi:trk system potassium uptake protein TrkH
MINWRQIFKVLGMLLFIEAGLLLITLAVALIYKEDVMPYVWTLAITIVLGLVGRGIGWSAGKNMGRRDGYLIVSLVWLVFSLIGMIPFILAASVPDVSSAFFEAMSGFTSTGATIMDNIDFQPKGILFWRSVTQWIGGIGIIFFTLAILPAFGVGEVKLFAAETTGPLHEKIHPRISVAVKWIGSVYLLLTVLCIASLFVCGMNLFDAVNIAMTTTGTGGFSPHAAFFHEQWNSPEIEYVTTIFMFLSGVNYTLLFYTVLKGRFQKFFQNPELRMYLAIVGLSTAVCTIAIMIHNNEGDLELSFRQAIFTTVSIQTTTGFASCDYTLWPQELMPVLMFLMFAGACSGSTSGGFKCIRWAILWEGLHNEFRRILHPRVVAPVKLNNEVIPTSIQKTLLAFVSLFVGSLFLGAFILILCGVDENYIAMNDLTIVLRQDFTEAFSLSLSSLSNVGPALGYYGPAHSWAVISPTAKVVCSILMLIGRLEIFPILILFTKGFWRKE